MMLTMSDATMAILLNGQPFDAPAGATVADLLAARGLDPRRVAVEVNEQLVRRDSLGDARLAPGDRVEIVTFVGGG